MSSRTFDGNSESAGPGFCPAPPPPPPPPVSGQVPALRINTVEAPVPRRSLPNSNNNPYEPPAAIQNAMMTKDKKPFTYTPGMGGKLDLSQIRSPRMARRVAKNANDEGIEGPPKSSLATEPRPVSAAPNLYIQPQVAVPVFPTNVPLQPSANRNSCAPPSRVPSNASDRGAEVQRPMTRVETKPISQVVSPQPTPPETPTTPPQVTLAKAPTPWLQNKNKPQEELPEWAKRSSVTRPSNSTSPESPSSQTAQIQILQAQPQQVTQTIQLQQAPASTTRQQQQPPQPSRQQSQPHERIIPLRIEDRPSVFSVKNEPGHHQFKQQPQQQSQPSSHHQQRWGNATPPQTPSQTQVPQYHNQNHQQQYQQQSRPQSSGGGTYIVPIMVEGNSNNGPSASTHNQQQPTRNQNVQNPSPRVIVQRGPPSPQIQQQGEPGPVQSRSFRVLQKITDTDVPDEVDGEQLRKLQLTEDDKVLMNKFKEQGRQWVDSFTDDTSRGWQHRDEREGSFDRTFLVDGDGNYLHQEEDPRYRGAAIPSRAFRFLQNMTDSGDVTTTPNVPRAPSAINKRQNRNSRTFEETQANLPPSEQQAPEPKKYTGSAIPSRSFRILQAMTSPESIAKQENRQAVIICRTETSMQPGNQQQGVFLSSSFPHDNSSLPLAQQSHQLSQLNALQLQSSQSHNNSQSSHMQQYETTQSQSSSSSSKEPISTLKKSRLQLTNPQPLESSEHLSELKISQLNPSQLEASSQLSRSHPSQIKSLHMQFSQFQPSALPPAFWQHPDGSLWWGYYPVHYPPIPNTSSSSSSSSSSIANNNPSLSHNTQPMRYENAYHIVCNHHQHHQDGTAFAYYHPFYDEHFYAAANAAITSTVPSGISSVDAIAAQRCTDLSSYLSSTTDEPLGEKTNVLPEDSSCSSKLIYASTPSTILQQAACLVPAFAHSQPTKTLPGYDSNCNPCLERTERSCKGETIFRCQPPFIQKSSGPAQRYFGSNDVYPRTIDQGMRNSWISQDPAFTEPGPPPWIRNNEKEILQSNDKSDISIDNGNEVGWNLDGTIGNQQNFQRSEQFINTKINDVKTNSAISSECDRRLIMDKSAWIGNNTNEPHNSILDTDKLKSNVNTVETKERWNKIDDEVKPLDRETKIDKTKWNRIDNASRNLNEIEPSIPMNILHDECNVNESPVIDKIKDNDDRCEDANVTDTDSDTDSGDSSADVEPVCTDRATNTEDESETESESDDSDSYLAYSTGLNPHNKFVRQANNRVDEDYKKSQTATTISEDAFDESTFAMSSDKLNSTDCESCVEEDEDVEQEAKIENTDQADFLNTKNDDISPHRLSVIPEVSEQNDRGATTPIAIGSDGWQNVIDDHNESATVSINLPLKFRFSVSEHEEENTDNVCVNLKLTDDTDISADFTLKKKNIPKESVTGDNEENTIDFWNTEETKSNTKIIESEDNKLVKEETKVDDDSKNTVNQDESIDFWETITSGRVTPDLNLKTRRQRGLERYFWNDEVPQEEEEIEKNFGDEEINEELSPSLKIDDSSRSEEEEGEDDDDDDDDDEESETAECPEEMVISEANEKEESTKITSTPLFELTEAKNDENEESNGRLNFDNSKHLLSVQNSRDETDDEDSGVTSDMSRLISEVDTDSECGPTRRINSYKRTQTHSRLFRLLSREDDPQIFEETKNNTTPRDRLSLPLKTSGFSYDESHHYSNYSSGLTSPDYSPVYEGTWRRLHGDDNSTEKLQSPGGVINDDESVKNRKDLYYENWKKTISDDNIREEVINSSVDAFKIVGNGNGKGLPNWRFRNNVLCPRIKSTKNVPRTVRNNRSAKPVISNSSTAKKVNDNAF